MTMTDTYNSGLDTYVERNCSGLSPDRQNALRKLHELQMDYTGTEQEVMEALDYRWCNSCDGWGRLDRHRCFREEAGP